ncbi:VOC family protein [Salinicola sp. DM10]|uniref:VOC family protein n=1 Tax=Salinicola sp. DM10 TaxID=2815721 RepID=UPI001A8C7D50|nr:VOC family protein [Salinicola sp. DM10]MCE3026883.1 VOC family protein [Salinicola sp. DM10]
MYSHIMLGARDLTLLTSFYDALLACLGLVRQTFDMDGGPEGEGWVPTGQAWPVFIVQYPFNGLPATWGNGVQVSFAAPTREAVNAAWRTAIERGGSSEGEPGLRPHYGEDYYGAYCRDPEGNKLCFVHASGMSS